MAQLAVRLAGEPGAAARARRALDHVSGHVDPDVLDELRLLVSELVSNSIRHANLGRDGWIDVSVRLEGDRVLVRVHDSGPGFRPVVHTGDAYRSSGWGLFLVDRLALRWGVDRDPAPFVWFELPARSGQRSTPAA